MAPAGPPQGERFFFVKKRGVFYVQPFSQCPNPEL